MTPITPYKEYSILHVWTIPGASSERLGEVVLDAQQQPYLKVYVTAVAEKGKANKAIISLLSKKLQISKSSIEIISGETDRHKRLLFQVSAEFLERALKEATGSLF